MTPVHKFNFLHILRLRIFKCGVKLSSEQQRRVKPLTSQEGTYSRVLVCGSCGVIHGKATDINHHVPILEESKGVQMNLMPHIVLKRFRVVALVIWRS